MLRAPGQLAHSGTLRSEALRSRAMSRGAPHLASLPPLISGATWQGEEVAVESVPRHLRTPVRCESLLDPPHYLSPIAVLTLNWGEPWEPSLLALSAGPLSFSQSWAGFAGVMELVNP